MQSQPNGAVSAPATITIDRNARKTLLAALGLRLEGHFEGIHKALFNRDRAFLNEAQEFFTHVGPILDGLEFWDEGGGEVPAHEYTIPATDWLRELIQDYAQQVHADCDGDEEFLSQVADKGKVEFEKGGQLYDPDATDHPNKQLQGWIVKMRRKLEHDRDELVGAQMIGFALLGAGVGAAEEGR